MEPIADPPTPVAFEEIELKLFVPASSIDRLWSHPLLVAHAIGPLQVARLVNRYFDTPEHALAGRRMALRLRRIGRRWLQTLKTRGAHDGALSVRGEWETPVAGPALELSKLVATPLATLGTPRVLAKQLVPVFSTDFRRETRRLRLSDGSEVEFAFDRGTIVAGRGATRRSASICEVEIELKQASGEDAGTALLRFAHALANDVALVPLAASKAERGYRLREDVVRAPAKVALPTPAPQDPAKAHLARVLTACNDALLANGHALLGFAAPSDEAIEYVHQARVAIRRMRSALGTFRAVAKGRRFDALDAALRALGHVFGEARDWDVLATATFDRLDDVVGRDADGAAALDGLRATIDLRRVAGHRALLDMLERGAFGATTLMVLRIVARMRTESDPGPSLADVAPRWLAKQFDRVVERARRIAVLDVEARHVLRVEVKRLRYALDLVGPVFEAATVAAFQDALSDLQTRLGRLNDEAVADRLLRSLEPGPPRDLAVARFAAWFERHIARQLPKVAAQSVALELAPRPWTAERSRAFGPPDLQSNTADASVPDGRRPTR